MEQPREPMFYENDGVLAFAIGERNGEFYAVGKKDNTLQSIDGTLKRIEDILLNQKNPFQSLQDAVEVSFSQHQEQPSVLHLNLSDHVSQLEQIDLQTK